MFHHHPFHAISRRHFDEDDEDAYQNLPCTITDRHTDADSRFNVRQRQQQQQ